MKVATARIVEPGAVPLRREQRFDVSALHEAQLTVSVALLQIPSFLQQVGSLPLLDCNVQLTPVQIAIDGVPFDPITDQAQSLDRDVPHAPGILESDLAFELP